MPRFNVNLDDKWACYSTVSDYFITAFMDRPEHEDWRRKEYGVQRDTIERSNNMTMQEAIEKMSIYHNRTEIMSNLIESGLSPTMAALLTKRVTCERPDL